MNSYYIYVFTTGDSIRTQISDSAQGLAEVLAVLGTNHVEALLPELLAGCADKSSAATREGHVVLLQYLPHTLEATFQPYLQVRHVFQSPMCSVGVTHRLSIVFPFFFPTPSASCVENIPHNFL